MGAILDLARRSRFVSDLGKRRWCDGQAIEMRARRCGFFPEAFVSRGRRHDVYAVERCWTVSRLGLGGRVERHCLRVRCREGAFDLYQDVRHNTWHLLRQVA